MITETRQLLLALAVAVTGSAALAQETTTATTPAPADTQTQAADQTTAPAADPAAPNSDLSLGQEQGTAAEPYVKQTFGDWQLRCVKAEKGNDPCELYQLLKDEKGNSVAEVSLVSLPAGGQAVAGATVIVPLETLLTRQLALAIDGAKPKSYPFSFCAPVGCFSRIGFTADEIAAMQKGAKATVAVAPIAAPDKLVSLNLSLKGFTDAFKAIKAEMDAATKSN